LIRRGSRTSLKVLPDVRLHKINVELTAPQLDIGKILADFFPVLCPDLGRINQHRPPCFHVHKAVRTVGKVESLLQFMILDVEKDHLMLVIPEMSESGK
jgi:hypothetical protein